MQVTSRFIETPYRKIMRLSYDLTSPEATVDLLGVNVIQGSYVRIDVKLWQDEEGKFDREEMAAFFKGAESVDIRVTRIPRENIRAASVISAATLPDKLVKRAGLVGETVAPEVLTLAGMLETVPGEELLKQVGEGGC